MRLLGWFSKLLISVLLISFLSVFTTAYIVDLYINRFLEQWNVADTLKPTVDAEDYVSKLINPSRIWTQDDSPSPTSIQEDEVLNEDHTATEEDDPGLPVFNPEQVTGMEQEDAQSPASSDLKDTVVMSAQEFNEKRKKLTNQDKSAIFAIVITKLPQKELQKMSLLLEDGITEEELGNLEDVMNAYLEQEEVTKLLAILNKY
ncbi:MAG: hypothetical protein WD424_05180 [Paenibacillaceae bacterium]